MRRRLLLGLVPSLPLVLLCFGGCSAAPVQIGLVMLAPQGLLDHSAVDLFVFDAKLGKCESSGHAVVPAGDVAQRFSLDKGGPCPPNITRCKTIELDKDGASKVFAVTAKDATGLIGEGCVVKAVNQDPLQVDIQIKRVIPKGCCNDGKLQAGEQCDSGVMADPDADGNPGSVCHGVPADDVCASDCRTKEILLSIDDPGPPNTPALQNGAPGTKTNLALAFGPPVPSYPNALRAVYVNSDKNDYSGGGSDINTRILGEDLGQLKDPEALGLQLTLPVLCSAVTAKGIVRAQQSPSIARVGDFMTIVYASDESTNGTTDIYLSPQIAEGCVDSNPCKVDAECITGVCDHTNKASICQSSVLLNKKYAGADNPDIAEGPGGSALITWNRSNTIYGRIWKANGALTPLDAELLITADAQNAHVAGNANGWKVVYDGVTPDDGDGVAIRTVDINGTVGDALRVNVERGGAQDQPDIAMLADGTALVVWRSAGQIFSQRFNPKGEPFERDQDHPLNTALVGDHQRPAVAASIGLGSFFAVAWETLDESGIGNISARFVTAAGTFGYNSVSGQNDEFVATLPEFAGDRHLPAVAIGGGGYVVIGWQDDAKDPDHHGVFVRRFPLPPFE